MKVSMNGLRINTGRAYNKLARLLLESGRELTEMEAKALGELGDMIRVSFCIYSDDDPDFTEIEFDLVDVYPSETEE